MVAVLKNNDENNCKLTAEQAREYFEATVREQLGVSAEEFLRRREEFKTNPHFDSIMFLLPLVENAQK